MRPLRTAGKLGAVLVQYPEWFTARKANRDELTAIRSAGPIFRSASSSAPPTWLAAGQDRERTLRVLADLSLALVVVDAPRAAKLPTVLEATTPELAVIRFHGRNDEPGRSPALPLPSASITLYSRPQVAGLGAKIETLAAKADNVHALMDNCYRDNGVRNTADLADLLSHTLDAKSEE